MNLPLSTAQSSGANYDYQHGSMFIRGRRVTTSSTVAAAVHVAVVVSVATLSSR